MRAVFRIVTAPSIFAESFLIAAEVLLSAASRSARILPLSLCWKSELLAGHGVQFYNELLDVAPAYTLNRLVAAFEIRRIHSRNL